MSDAIDLLSEPMRHWFGAHGTTCGWILAMVVHQYYLQFNMRRVLGMRRGDGILLMPPRESAEEIAAGGRPWWKWILFAIWHPKRPTPMRRRSVSRPPDPPPAKPSDFHDQQTQR